MPHLVCSLDGWVATNAGLAGEPVLCDWVRALGVDPSGCLAFRVYADGDGTVEFDMLDYYEAADGRLLATVASVTTVVTKPLSAPIPQEVLAAGRVS